MSSEHVFSLQTPKNPVVSEASPRTIAKAAQRSDGNNGRSAEERAMNTEGWLLLGSAKEHSQSFRCTEVRWKKMIKNVNCAPGENGLTPPGSLGSIFPAGVRSNKL